MFDARREKIPGRLVAAIGLAAIVGASIPGCDIRKPPLPPVLAEIRCPEDRQGYVILRLGEAELYAPCWSTAFKRSIEEGWEKNRRAGRTAANRSQMFHYAKTPEGGFVAPSRIERFPDAARFRYTLHVTFSEDPIRPLEKADVRGHWELPLAPPAPFSATGSQAIFYCEDAAQRRDRRHDTCFGRLKSASLYWSVRVTLGNPTPSGVDIRAEVAEAVALLAAHLRDPSATPG